LQTPKKNLEIYKGFPTYRKTVPPCFTKDGYLATKKPTGGRFYLSLMRTLLLATFAICYYGRTRSRLLNSSDSSEGYFDCLLSEDLAPDVFSLVSQ